MPPPDGLIPLPLPLPLLLRSRPGLPKGSPGRSLEARAVSPYAAPMSRRPVPALLIALVFAAASSGSFAEAEERAAAASVASAGAIEALRAAEEGRFVRARTLAEAALARDPSSAVAEMVLGQALHEGEGNIPLALDHFRRALTLAEGEEGEARPGFERWHRQILFHLLWASSDLGRFEEALSISARIRQLYDPLLHGSDVWPLMKLGREEEARDAAARALATGDAIEEVIGRNGLCALDGYPACIAVLEAVRRHDLPAGLSLRNAGVAAQDAGRFEEAERLLLESTRLPDEDANPWRDLASLYATEGRLGEAVAAAREMVLAARAASRRVQQHTRALVAFSSAEVLLLAGHPERALATIAHALAEPDRAAHWSGTEEARHAETALLERAIRTTLAEVAAERASLSGWVGAASWRVAALGQRVRAWYAGRRVTPVLLAGGLDAGESPRPAAPQLAAPPWLQLDAVALVGPASVRVLAERWIRTPPLHPAARPPELRAAYLSALRAEAICLAGSAQDCVESATQARAALPPEELLLLVRLAARAADAAMRQGEIDLARSFYEEVLARDPAVMRRLGLSLPASLRPGGGSTIVRAAQRALTTPRFTEAARAPFRVGDVGGRLCLEGLDGVIYACASPASVAADGEFEGDETARLAAALIDEAFAPRLELSQRDLTTLDGSAVAERRIDPRELDLLEPAPGG